MAHLSMKKNKGNYEVNVFFNEKSKSHYRNIMDKDPQKLAQVLLDLTFEGFPIEKAIKIWKERMDKKDWLGL